MTTILSQPLTLDPETDDLRPVGELMQRLAGRRPSPPTVWRWCSRGTARAGRLPALRVLGCWCTTAEALLAWLQRGSEPAPAPADDPEHDAATERKLRKAGLL